MKWSLLIIGLLLSAGCAHQPGDRAPLSDRIAASDGRAIAYRDVTDAERRPAVDLPADARLDDFIAAAIAHNPRIKAAQFELQRLTEQVTIASSLDDPMLEIAPMGRTWQSDVDEVMVSVSQTIPFPGKRAARRDIARTDVAAAAAKLQQTRLDIAADVRRAYWSVHRTRQALEIRSRTRRLLEQFQASAQANFRAGNVSQQDVLRASVELSELDRDVADLRQQRDSAIAMLNTLMNRDPDAPLPDIVPADPAELDLRTQDLLETAWQANPAIRQAHQRIESARLRQKLARLDRLPDFTIGAGYNFVESAMGGMSGGTDDEWSLSLGINLPIWFDKLRAAERAAAFDRYAAIADLAAQRNDITFRIHDAAARIRSQQTQIALLRDRILPEARQTVQAGAAAYRAGRGSFIELLDNWRILLTFELMYHDNLAAFEQALADLEQIVAQPRSGATASPVQTTQPTE